MPREREYWHICMERDGDWEDLGSCETRAEAEMQLRSMQAGVFPDAFLVRLTMTRLEPVSQPTTRTAVSRRG